MTARRDRHWPRTFRDGIETQRLVLRGLALGDHKAWAAGYGGRRAARTPYDAGPVAARQLTRARFEALVLRHERLARKDDVYVFAAFAKGSGAHLGMFDLSTIRRRDNGWANIGYFVHNQHQGQGYGVEGLRGAIGIGVAPLAYHRIEAAIRPDNTPAIACAKAAGMRHEGLRRSFWLDDDGWADHEVFVSIAD